MKVTWDDADVAAGLMFRHGKASARCMIVLPFDARERYRYVNLDDARVSVEYDRHAMAEMLNQLKAVPL